MKKILPLIGILLILFSCGTQNSETKTNVENDSIVASVSSHEIEAKANPTGTGTYRDTIKINYAEHKDLLEILRIIPDSAFRSWNWTKRDRDEFVKFISLNNFTVDTTDMYMTIKMLKPNTIRLQVVDGSWTLSIYKAGHGNYIVVTDDRTTTDDVKAFEYNNGKLKAIKVNSLFGDLFKEMLLIKDDTACWKFLEENTHTFDYNFENEARARISSAYLNKERSNNCLKGNALDLHFNAQTKRFELSGVSWLGK